MTKLKLRRARVVDAASPGPGEQRLQVMLDGEQAQRDAVAQLDMVGVCEVGDDVVVNVQALDLGLGSGGFDFVHVNLTRGLVGEGVPATHVMKLNYTSLQHAVHPVDAAGEGVGDTSRVPVAARALRGQMAPTERVADARRMPVGVLALHGQLAPVAWAFAAAAPGARLGYVQTAGGALHGGHSRVVGQLRAAGLLADHVTAGSAFGGEHEAISLAGALAHAAGALGWDAAVCGPGPGIVGSGGGFGHGGMVALDSAHTALALGCPTVIVARMSSSDPRPRHVGLSHHSQTVLRMLLAPVTVGVPSGFELPPEVPVRAPRAPGPSAAPLDIPSSVDPRRSEASGHLGETRVDDVRARIAGHDWRHLSADLAGYTASGLPAQTMGRSIEQDPLFFASALAGGGALAGMAAT